MAQISCMFLTPPNPLLVRIQVMRAQILCKVIPNWIKLKKQSFFKESNFEACRAVGWVLKPAYSTLYPKLGSPIDDSLT